MNEVEDKGVKPLVLEEGVWCSVSSAFLTTHDHQPFGCNAEREIPPFATKIRPFLFILSADVLRTCVFYMKGWRTQRVDRLSVVTATMNTTLLCFATLGHTRNSVQRPEDMCSIHCEHI